MKPQDRTRAIVESRLEPAMKLLLLVVADFMNKHDRCFPSIAAISKRSSYCERQVQQLVKSAEQRGLLLRVQGAYRTPDIEIAWDVVRDAEAPPTARGGLREAKTAPGAKTAPIDAEGGKDCTPPLQRLHPTPAKTAPMGGKDCTQSVHQAFSEAITEAYMSDSPAHADEPTPTTTPEADREPSPASTTATDARPDAGSQADGCGGPVHEGGAGDASRPANEDGVPVEQAARRAGPAVKRPRNAAPADVEAAFLRCIEEVRQRPVNPERTATDRKTLHGLWTAIGKPPADEIEADFRAVARWARESEDKAAARDIRAIGWEGGTDRHRDIGTLTCQRRWGSRLELARAWSTAMGDKPTGAAMDWTESDEGRRLAQKRINGAPEIVGSTKRMTFLARRTFNQIGGIKAWGGRPVSAEWVAAWRREWPASVEAWERQPQAGAAK